MRKDHIKVFSITVEGRTYFGVAPSVDLVGEWIDSLSDSDYARLFFSSDRNYEIEETDKVEYTFHSTGGFIELWLNGCEVPCKFHIDK